MVTKVRQAVRTRQVSTGTDLAAAQASVQYIDNQEFQDAQSRLPRETAELLSQIQSKGASASDQRYLYSHGLGDLPVLTKEAEQLCFRAMNFLKYQIRILQRSISWKDPDPNQIRQILELHDQVRRIRDHLIYSNLRLVISLVKKFVSPVFSFDELYSEGVVTLMQTVEKFDYQRGFRFSTYAYRSISRSLYNLALQQQQENALFTDDSEHWVADAVEPEPRGQAADHLWQSMRDRLSSLVQQLDRREQLIVRARYALSPCGKIKTFQVLADKLGISKERVRQLEQRAVAKLQALASTATLAN
jgi:RNA polymerase primary sigma factor